jgi:hypothetical protein
MKIIFVLSCFQNEILSFASEMQPFTMKYMRHYLLLLCCLFILNTSNAQGKLMTGPFWEELYGTTQMFPMQNDGMWIVSVSWFDPDPERKVRITQLDNTGTQVVNILYESTKQLKGHDLIGCVSDKGNLALLTALHNNAANTISFQRWPVASNGTLSTSQEIWSLNPGEKLNSLYHTYQFDLSDDLSHFVLGSYDGRRYASFRSDGSVVTEGDITSLDRLTLVKQMAVSDNGTIGILLFTNQDAAFTTVKQEISAMCHYTDGQTRRVNLQIPEGYVSPGSMQFVFPKNGDVVLAGFTFFAKSEQPQHAFVTEIISGEKDPRHHVYPISGAAEARVSKAFVRLMDSGHLVLMPNRSAPWLVEFAPDFKARMVDLDTYTYSNDLLFGITCMVDSEDAIIRLVMCDENCVEKKGKGSGSFNRGKGYHHLAIKYVPGAEAVVLVSKEISITDASFNYSASSISNVYNKNKYYTIGQKGKKWCLMTLDMSAE